MDTAAGVISDTKGYEQLREKSKLVVISAGLLVDVEVLNEKCFCHIFSFCSSLNHESALKSAVSIWQLVSRG